MMYDPKALWASKKPTDYVTFDDILNSSPDIRLVDPESLPKGLRTESDFDGMMQLTIESPEKEG